MRVSTAALMVMLSLATTAVASRSAGQTPPGAAPADAGAAQAVRHYEDGVRAAKLERWSSAHASFLAAWKLKKHYQIAANLGRAELRLTRYRDAAEHLAYFLREAQDVAPAERKAAEAMLDEARANVGSLTIIVDRVGAEVLVDGVTVGRAPLGHEVFVAPGSRTIEAKLSGFGADRRALNVVAGSTPKVLLTPTLRAAGPADRLARPAITPQLIGLTPIDPDEPPEGHGSSGTAILAAGVTTTTIAAGVGVVSLAIAITRGNEAQAIADECAAGPPYCPLRQGEYDALVDDEAMFKNLAFWAFIGAGAAGAGTLVYALVRPSPGGNTGLTPTVALGPGGGGLSIKKVW